MTPRIGLLTPSSNTVLEPVTARLVAPLGELVSLHYSRFPVTLVSESTQSDRQFGMEPMLAAAELLMDARMDLILWSGTSGAWQGLEHDRALVEQIQARFGTKATTATLSLVELLKRLGVSRFGLVVPYIEEITMRIVSSLTGLGFTCTSVANEGLTDNFEFARVSTERIAQLVRGVSRSRPDVVIIHCTNLRGADVAAPLASELGIPVLDSVVVALWGALDSLALKTTLPGIPTSSTIADDRSGGRLR